MGSRGRGRGRAPKRRGAKGNRTLQNVRKGQKRGKDNQEEDSPTKLPRGESVNTQIRKAIQETKTESQKKTVFKPDPSFIYQSRDKKVSIYEDYSCMLNQTNIGQNNNKFYVIQVGCIKAGYICFTKWGRVGELGCNNLEHFKDPNKAIAAFKAKFKSKTKNDWEKRESFKAHPGKYTLLEIDEESDDEEELNKKPSNKSNTAVTNCTLDERTAVMIELIFNDDMFISQMSHMNLDVRKMPLGKLSKIQIAKGLEALLDIEKAFQAKKSNAELAKLSSLFYTLIPHDFGRRTPSVINDQSVIDQKKELMITLGDIELTQSLQKEQGNDVIHPLDDKYRKLKCQLDLVNKTSGEYKMVEKFSKACSDTRQATIKDVWRVNRAGEDIRFAQHKHIKHRKLLWHGTSVAVVAAILNSGLRIMPHSGGRVGSGIYFASEHSKSASYVCPYEGTFRNEAEVGFMFLVEVALGKECEINVDAPSLKKAPQGFESVVAIGQQEPDPKANVVEKFDGNDVIVPLGKPIPRGAKSHFYQSEYLVYKESQARIRYLLKFCF